MSEADPSARAAAADTLAQRYGRKRARPRSRWRAWAFGVVAVIVSIAIALLAYRNLGSSPISAQRVGFAERPGHSMEITIDVERDQPAREAVCIVRVSDASKAESGRKEVYVPPGEEGARIRTVIQSATRPVTADVFGCSYSVPEYLSRR